MSGEKFGKVNENAAEEAGGSDFEYAKDGMDRTVDFEKLEREGGDLGELGRGDAQEVGEKILVALNADMGTEEATKAEDLTRETLEDTEVEDLKLDDSESEEGAKAEGEKKISALEQRLNDAAFENVDLLEVNQVTREYLEKIEKEDLKELRRELAEDLKVGVEKVEDYFAEKLELRYRPEIEWSTEMHEQTLGDCRIRGRDKSDLIRLNANFYEPGKANVDQLLETLAHENWHSWQHQEIFLAKYEMDEFEYVQSREPCIYIIITII